MQNKRFTYLLALGATMAVAVLADVGHAQVIINDDFADGSPLNSGAPLESQWFSTNSPDALALDSSPTGDQPGTLEFATGPSGRGIHTVFGTQQLSNVGDMISASISFTTPQTIGTDEVNGFKIGLFNEANGSLAQNLTAITASPSPLLGDIGSSGGTTPGVDGFVATFDVNDLTNFGLADDDVRIRQSVPSQGSGRLLLTTSGFTTIASSSAPNDINGFVSNEDYETTLTITRVNATDVLVETELNDNSGNILNSTSGFATATSFDFSVLAVSALSDAFGTSNTVDDSDNGLRLNSAFVEFNSAIPEPGSATVLLSGLASLGLIRRRK